MSCLLPRSTDSPCSRPHGWDAASLLVRHVHFSRQETTKGTRAAIVAGGFTWHHSWAGSTGLGTCKNFSSGVCGQQQCAIKQKPFLQNKESFICQNRHSTRKYGLRKSQESYAYTILPILRISLKHLFLLWFVLADPIRDCAVQTLTLS